MTSTFLIHFHYKPVSTSDLLMSSSTTETTQPLTIYRVCTPCFGKTYCECVYTKYLTFHHKPHHLQVIQISQPSKMTLFLFNLLHS